MMIRAISGTVVWLSEQKILQTPWSSEAASGLQFIQRRPKSL